MKRKHAYLKTSLWHREKIKDPLQVIANVFNSKDIQYYRCMIQEAVQAAKSEKVYRKKEPGTLLFDFEKLEKLVNAAFLLVAEKTKSPIIVAPHQLMDEHLYCGRDKHLHEWDYFPRHLTKEEYCNPYLAFKHFFKFQPIEEWKKDLKEILDHSLVWYYDDPDVDLLSVNGFLLKLVEAAHLIDVREITHVEGQLKKRF